MPENNRKVLDRNEIDKLNSLYRFKYDDKSDEIIVSNTTNARTSRHSCDSQFVINCVKYKHVIVFNFEAIVLFKDLYKDKSFSSYSLIDINNAVNKLKIIYQPITKENVIYVLKNY